MLFSRSALLYMGLVVGCLCSFVSSAEPTYVPEPELADLIKRAIDGDKATAIKSIEQLAAKGPPAERAINYLMFKDGTTGRAKYAELLARANFGRIGYRIIMEL